MGDTPISEAESDKAPVFFATCGGRESRALFFKSSNIPNALAEILRTPRCTIPLHYRHSMGTEISEPSKSLDFLRR